MIPFQQAYQKRRKVYLDWRVAQKFEKLPIGLHPKKGTTFSREYAREDRVLKEGFSLNEHAELLHTYLLEYLKEKASKGFLVEMASGSYGPRMLMMFLLVHEYAEDSKLKTFAKNIIDLWWATWAEEQINGERGGGKVRQRSLKGLTPNEQIGHLAHMYLGIGSSEFKDYPTMLIFRECSFAITKIWLKTAITCCYK